MVFIVYMSYFEGMLHFSTKINKKRRTGDCPLSYSCDPVKGVVGITFRKSVSVDYRSEFSVIRVVGIGSQRVVSRLDLAVISELVVDKGKRTGDGSVSLDTEPSPVGG